MIDFAKARISIVGLGLMGASLSAALRGHCRCVVGVARRSESIETALTRGLIDCGTTDLANGVHNANIIVLATPVRVILRLLHEFKSLLLQECLLIDLGSTKSRIITQMMELPDHIQPLGGHPMCGKEVSGLEAADSELFRGCTFVLTPLPRTSEAALVLGHTLVKTIGAQPLLLGPERHDRLVAASSHLPYLLACSLVGTAGESAAVDPMVWRVTASGFRDTSRLAASDVTMMLDILLTNREAVLQALQRCRGQLGHLTDLVQSGDEQGLTKALEAHRAQRLPI